MPDAAIRTTFIVGFPGETEAEFQELLAFVRTARFDRVGAFSYSPQEGTPAAIMADQIPEPVKADRLERLMALQAEISAEINASLIGREFPILVESVEGSTGPDGEPIFVGRSYRDAPEVDGLVFVQGLARPGTMPRVRITGAMEHDLLATPGRRRGGPAPHPDALAPAGRRPTTRPASPSARPAPPRRRAAAQAKRQARSNEIAKRQARSKNEAKQHLL